MRDRIAILALLPALLLHGAGALTFAHYTHHHGTPAHAASQSPAHAPDRPDAPHDDEAPTHECSLFHGAAGLALCELSPAPAAANLVPVSARERTSGVERAAPARPRGRGSRGPPAPLA